MKVTVDKNLCIGCGACQAIEPSVFKLDDNGIAEAKNEEIKEEIKENVMDALEGCPTSAISEVK